MIIRSSVNCPTVICSPTVCYFYREKPLVKPMAPGSLSHIICLCDVLLFASFYFVFYCDLFIQTITILSHHRANFWRRCPKGIDNPFNTSGCEYLLFVCRSCLRSYWFDNLGFFTEGNTYRRYAASSLPL